MCLRITVCGEVLSFLQKQEFRKMLYLLSIHFCSEKQWEVTEKVWLDVYSLSCHGLSHSSCVFSPSFHVSLPSSLYLPLFSFHFLLNILLSIRKSPLLQLPAGKIPLCWIFKEQSGKPQTHVIFASLRWTLVQTVASPFSSSSKRVAESACSWKGFPCISFFQTYRNLVYTAFGK